MEPSDNVDWQTCIERDNGCSKSVFNKQRSSGKQLTFGQVINHAPPLLFKVDNK
ncbi:hypothetical protein VP96_02740 [Vibrio cholerae]|nr:hypothetical protein VCEM1626_000783 [Vibrio cholerae O1 str. EM-1626]KKP09918.1 hypothetical protein VP96_02740 [Vibrio cholerae]